jgi:BlaI family transcriptional regulator, penicillinase repressor
VSVAFTERELDLMAVLWDRGPSTAAEVREALSGQGVDLAYNTVLTLLRILEDKGHVDHKEEGRAHRFRAAVKRKEAGASALRRTLDRMFGGSAEALVAQLVQQRGLSKDDLKRLRRVVDEQLASKLSGNRVRPKSGDRR